MHRLGRRVLVSKALFGPARWIAAVIVAGALWGAARPGAVGAQGGIQVIAAPAPTYDFGGKIAFQVTASSPLKIAAVNLFVNTGGLSPATWHSAPFRPRTRSRPQCRSIWR